MKERRRTPDPCVFVIFGASGDLTQRKLIPGLYSLAHDGLLPAGPSQARCANLEPTGRAAQNCKGHGEAFLRIVCAHVAAWRESLEVGSDTFSRAPSGRVLPLHGRTRVVFTESARRAAGARAG